ncbi:hypothetical protein PN498_20830 [Oscillatoria sp. CS-180]|uniref:hypothetical protein n=1 Tax=Oscillatoria sp. CS-180 TaxID=3021720 RepID=UPI0023300BE9|nr:hypothetical protein [Oscillatoria sp. CS-180]MDB9528449.1 hypothetical protein [Oscillatoria sp. CS-180]
MSIDKSNRGFLSKAFKLTGAVALLTASVVLPACSNSTEVAEDPIEAAEENNVTAEEVTGSVEDYIGQTVTVREEAEELVGEYAFLLDEDQLFGGERILVINASGEGLTLVEGEGTDVQVTGEVREFVLADVEQEYDLELEPDLFGDYEEQPVIIAQSLALAPDPDDINERPEDYYGKRIAVEGEVDLVMSDNVITLDEEVLFGEEDLLVVSPDTAIAYPQGEEVVVTGTLRPFVYAEFDRDYELTWDIELQQEVEAEYESRPVFVADEIYPSAL